MQHFSSIEEAPSTPVWLTIGVFDGVHLGHQAILHRLVEGAKSDSASSLVITFHPHPAVVLGKIGQPRYLTPPQERARLLGESGVDLVITLPFTLQMASLSAEEFMHGLSSRFEIRRLLAGADFALGRGREGNLERLREIGHQMGFDLLVIEPVRLEGERISSSLIRDQLQKGEVRQASRLLGRNYRIIGNVIHGDGRGKQLGFPTANLQFWEEQLLPAGGVYATWAWVNGRRYPSVTNLGFRPTFDQQSPQPHLETHLLNFHQNLYNQTLELEFVQHLRSEIRFTSVDALIEQVNRDKKTAEEVLAHAP
ncbi:MAG: bifunctional riboflavin kinase/FAD synthetase [Chloroflexota bacterium]